MTGKPYKGLSGKKIGAKVLVEPLLRVNLGTGTDFSQFPSLDNFCVKSNGLLKNPMNEMYF
jgi:hypothetical protein